MKLPLLFIALFACFLIPESIGQSRLVDVSVNNIDAKIFNNGVLFNGIANDEPAFEVPAGGNTHAFKSAGLTMAGIDTNGRLSAASAFKNGSDYSSGPLTIGTATSNDSIRMAFNRVWQLNRAQIDQHRTNFSNPSYTIPQDIAEWPAHGDTTAGYASNLAPFIDVNNNGIYDPSSGDYPDVPGDFIFYFINNDGTLGTFTNTPSIGSEIHCMVYGFTQNNALNEALFVDYRVINRSNKNYRDFYVGQYVDTELGNNLDDYLEADVNRGMVFTKNGDDFDDPFWGYTGYGNNLGAAGVLVLRGPQMDANGLDDSCMTSPLYTPNGWGFEDGIIDNELLGLTHFMPLNNNNSNNGLPNLGVHFYNYLRGIWKNGQNLTFGGNGFTPAGGSGTNCRIAYFGDTDPSFYSSFGDTVLNNWTEDANNNPAGDRSAMLSSGPFTFSSGEELHLTYAYFFARNTSQTGVAASVDTLKRSADFIREFYFSNNGLSNCFTPLSIGENELQDLTIFPVPTNDYLRIRNIPVNSQFQIFSIDGKLIKEGNLSAGEDRIKVSSIQNGIYLFRLQNQEGYAQRRVVISR